MYLNYLSIYFRKKLFSVNNSTNKHHFSILSDIDICLHWTIGRKSNIFPINISWAKKRDIVPRIQSIEHSNIKCNTHFILLKHAQVNAFLKDSLFSNNICHLIIHCICDVNNLFVYIFLYFVSILYKKKNISGTFDLFLCCCYIFYAKPISEGRNNDGDMIWRTINRPSRKCFYIVRH